MQSGILWEKFDQVVMDKEVASQTRNMFQFNFVLCSCSKGEMMVLHIKASYIVNTHTNINIVPLLIMQQYEIFLTQIS